MYTYIPSLLTLPPTASIPSLSPDCIALFFLLCASILQPPSNQWLGPVYSAFGITLKLTPLFLLVKVLWLSFWPPSALAQRYTPSLRTETLSVKCNAATQMQSAQHLQNRSGNSLRKKLASLEKCRRFTSHLVTAFSSPDKRPCKLPALYLKDAHFLKAEFLTPFCKASAPWRRQQVSQNKIFLARPLDPRGSFRTFSLALGFHCLSLTSVGTLPFPT